MTKTEFTAGELITALQHNFEVYSEEGIPYARTLYERLLKTRTKDEAVARYLETVREFYDKIYFEINEDYARMNRHQDLLLRWQAAANFPERRKALERLISNFDLNNYSPPAR